MACLNFSCAACKAADINSISGKILGDGLQRRVAQSMLVGFEAGIVEMLVVCLLDEILLSYL
jgi:hypothetical protein